MKLAWIAADWGTSNLRVWGLDAQNNVLVRAQSDAGMGGLRPEEFEPALLDLVKDWLDESNTPVLACGMVGAAQGWVDAGYRAVPTGQHLNLNAVDAPVKTTALRVQVLSGVSQQNPYDVMRGEETQIAGYVAENKAFTGVLCLPGTHTKWAQVTDGEIFHFTTFMTGEIYALFSKHSVLRHSVSQGFDADAFATAVEDAMAHPEKIAAKLFPLRAEALLAGLDPVIAAARLSGYLIGLEFAATRPYWLGQKVVLMAEGVLREAYEIAFDHVGLALEIADPELCVLQGLIAAKLELDAKE